MSTCNIIQFPGKRGRPEQSKQAMQLPTQNPFTPLHDRLTQIKHSMEQINALMAQLKNMEKKK